jgi:hypothetical protein
VYQKAVEKPNKEKSRREKINDSCRDDLFEALGYITVPPKT